MLPDITPARYSQFRGVRDGFHRIANLFNLYAFRGEIARRARAVCVSPLPRKSAASG
jgi:hypothetical protein